MMLVAAESSLNEEDGLERKLIPSGAAAMLLFVGTEVMLFASFISAYLIIRAGAAEWPPWGQPRLPIEATAFNTLVLLASAVALGKCRKLMLREELPKSRRLLGVAFMLGVFFVGFQGYEWVQLVGFGLTMTSSTFGALFYLIIGGHALHVFCALMVLLYAWLRLGAASESSLIGDWFLPVQIFWYFVVGLWPFLYVLVYLI